MLGLLSIGVGLYAGVIGLTLMCFSIYSICLMSGNITSNENLRTRWHAKRGKALQRKRDRLGRKANEQMTPEEMEEHSSMQADEKLEKARSPNCCSKLAYFFCKQNIPSHLQTYLELKESEGRQADYSVIDNESVLKNYGIVIPELPEAVNTAEEESKQDDTTAAVNNSNEGDEETKHLLKAHDSD